MSTGPAAEKRDDSSLFDDLFTQHNRPVYAYLLGRCREPDTAADLLQETYMRAWRHIDDVRGVPEDRRRYWLLAVARNAAHDHYRRQAVRAPFANPLPETLPSAEPAHDPVSAAEAGAAAAVLDAAIDGLPEDLRLVVTMRYVGEMSSAEIGEALGRPSGTVRYQLSQARSLLARRLGPTLGDAGTDQRESG